MKLGLIFFSLPAVAVFVACSGSSDRTCFVGADCASGVCRSDGTCAAPAGTSSGNSAGSDASVVEAGGADGSSSSSSSSSSSGDGGSSSGDSAVMGCVPNHDGTITRQEVPLGPGLHGVYLVATNAPVDTTGTKQPDGSRIWDLTGVLAGDHSLIIETKPVTGQWFASDYPNGTYTARLSDTADLLGVFETTQDAIALLGEASPSDGNAATKLIYSAPVSTLQFPMKMGSSWQSNVNVTGLGQGIPVYYTEAYTSKVDAWGKMKTPYATFDVLRVSVNLTRTVAAVPTTIHTFSFVSECVGPVATIVSQDNETTDEFTTAAEVQRLTP